MRRNDRRRPVKEHIVNKDIRLSKLFVIDENKEKVGMMSRNDALDMAKSRGLDLILLSPDPKKPVARFLDYGKFKYERSKKQKEAKSKQAVTNNREVRLTPMIGIHDLKVKARKAREFLENGDRVKVSLKFRGREMARKDLGHAKMKEFYELIEDVAAIQKEPELKNGRFLDMFLISDKGTKKGGNKNAKNENKKSVDKAD